MLPGGACAKPVLSRAAGWARCRPEGWLDTADVAPTAAALWQALALAASAAADGNFGPCEQARPAAIALG
jgi:hypothetical protein